MVGKGRNWRSASTRARCSSCQFEAIRHFAGNDQRAHLLPLGIQELLDLGPLTPSSMGCSIIASPHRAHRAVAQPAQRRWGAGARDPGGGRRRKPGADALRSLRQDAQRLVPPSSAALARWVERCGFTDVRIVDENMTSTDEQRRTDWMINESLSDYLDPQSCTHGRRIPGTQTCRTDRQKGQRLADGGCGSYTDPIPGSTVK